MFLEELSKITNLPISEVLREYTISNVGGKVVNISNFSKLITYLPELVVVKVKNGNLNIEGSNLKIMELSKNSVTIQGVVHSCVLQKVSQNEN